MAKVNIDGKEYEFDELSDKAKANLVSLQFVQGELKRLDAQDVLKGRVRISNMKKILILLVSQIELKIK